jgi:hypothetical protein
MRTLKLIARFYSGIFFVNLLITLGSIPAIHAHKLLGAIFWFKLITIGIVFYFTASYKKKELYYYQNLGLSKLMLGVTTSLFDFLLWLIISIVAYQTQ